MLTGDMYEINLENCQSLFLKMFLEYRVTKDPLKEQLIEGRLVKQPALTHPRREGAGHLRPIPKGRLEAYLMIKLPCVKGDSWEEVGCI